MGNVLSCVSPQTLCGKVFLLCCGSIFCYMLFKFLKLQSVKKRIYSKQVGDKGLVRRSMMVGEELIKSPNKNCTTVYESFKNAAAVYKNNKCLGTRELIKVHKKEVDFGKDGKKIREFYELGPYEWDTYGTCFDISDNLSSGLRHIGLNPKDRIGMYHNTSKEWTLMEQAAYMQSITILTVYANLGINGLIYALKQGEIEYLFTEGVLLNQLVKIAEELHEEGLLSHIIYTPLVCPTEEDKEKLQKNVKTLQDIGIEVYRYEEIISLGEENKFDHTPPKSDDVSCIMYTSGSTGNPKGVMITHGNMVACMGGLNMIFKVEDTDVYLNFLPLAHVLALAVVNGVMHKGLPVGIGNPRTLLDTMTTNCKGDFTELKPTVMAGVPMIYDRVKKGILAKLAAAGAGAQLLFKVCFTIKKFCIEQLGVGTPLLDVILFNKFKSAMGGNCRVMVSGGAPLSAEVQNFLQICFGIPVLQGYGLTETTGAGCVMALEDNNRKRVGAPLPCTEIKLVDVPEMDYYNSDKPNPRGEIWIRGPAVSIGYFKNKEKTDEVFTEDKWFKTGDVGMWNENGTLSIIDRIKNLIKGPHGEYIALEKLESTYKNSAFVANICVYVDTENYGNVAIINPNLPHIDKWKESNNIDSYDEVYSSSKFIKEVISDINSVGLRNKFKSIEKIAHLIVDAEEWTPDNHCLTAAMKLNRRSIYARHDDTIKSLWN